MIDFSCVLFNKDGWHDINCPVRENANGLSYYAHIFPSPESSEELFWGKSDFLGESSLSEIKISKKKMKYTLNSLELPYPHETFFEFVFNEKKGIWIGDFLGISLGSGEARCIMPTSSYLLIRN